MNLSHRHIWGGIRYRSKGSKRSNEGMGKDILNGHADFYAARSEACATGKAGYHTCLPFNGDIIV